MLSNPVKPAIFSPISGLRAAPAFSPATLFAAGEQGAWYDPSDFSTLFQDSAGSTPVTAVEQPVRLMRDISGRTNHATAPNDASRPVLRARYNLLRFTEQFDNAGWTKQIITVTANAAVAPDGTTTADALLEGSAGFGFNRAVFQSFAVAAGVTVTATFYVKANGRDFVRMGANRSGFTGGAYLEFQISAATVLVSTTYGTGLTLVSAQAVYAGNGWYRLILVATFAAADASAVLVINVSSTSNFDTAYAGDITKGILIWGAQLLTAADQAATGGAYQRVAAATDYDTGPAFRPYLAFDGTDDSFSTSSIDFSATDKMTVFAGVTKLSDAARGVIAELTASAAANNGAFLLAAPNAASATFAFESKGTALTDAIETSIAAPTTAVLTGIGDISGDVTTLRRNGTQRDSDTGDQGTDNYANAALFIGRRNNASLPFNGRLYSLLVLGRAATNPELTSTETWINGKTGAYL